MANQRSMPTHKKPKCSLCGHKRRIIRVMRPAGQGDQTQDDPDYAVRFCDDCDTAS